MEIFESRNGSHWASTRQHRPLDHLPASQRALFILRHMLLLPFAILVLLITAASLPLYWLWSLLRKASPPQIDPRAQTILTQLTVNPGFISGMHSEVTPHVSVVMPFYNRAEWIHWSLGSVLSQSLPAGIVAEVIAVDNASTDYTLRELRKYPVRVVQCEERGPGAARNAGIAAARAPIIAFIDSDCLADPGWLAALIKPFDDPSLLLAGGDIRSFDQDNFAASFAHDIGLLDNRRFFCGSGYFPPFFATANAAYKREALQQAGGFDNAMWMSEDADLAWRVLDLGGRMAFTDDAVVYHLHRKGLRSLWRQSTDYGAAAVSVFAKHRRSLGVRSAISWRNIRDIAFSSLALAKAIALRQPAHVIRTKLLYPLWRLGFTVGCVRACFRHRVIFL